jgi:hypothetical protein
MRAGSWVLVAVLAVAGGCGGSRARPHLHRATRDTAAERKAIFGDWYADGRIDGDYPCAIVRNAMRHLPSSPPIYSTVLQDFERYERRVC